MKSPLAMLPNGRSMSTGTCPGCRPASVTACPVRAASSATSVPEFAGADHEHGPLGELLRPLVVQRVQLSDRGVQLARELRHDRDAVRAGRDDDVLGEHLVAVAELEAERAVGRPREGDDTRRRAHRQTEVLRVPLEVVAHLLPGRVAEHPDVEAQPRQARERRGVNRRRER